MTLLRLCFSLPQVFHCFKKTQRFGPTKLRKYSNVTTKDETVKAINCFILLGKERNNMFLLFFFHMHIE